jgi:hypothetical protein
LPVLVIAPRTVLVPLEYSDGMRPYEGHGARRGGKASGVAEFGGDGERGEIIDAAETAQALHTRAQRVEIEQGTQVLFDGPEPGDDFVHGPQIGAMGLVERRDRPRLCPQPGIVTLRPGLLSGGKPAAMP